jgi:MoxR-like ATPase
MDHAQLEQEVQKQSAFVSTLLTEVEKVIVGQRDMLEKTLIGILADGHVLLEGVPGLAKTMTVRSFAGAIKAKFARVQFTPDLLPADLVGTLVYNQGSGNFDVKKGPVFANVVLADEINRAPAKVQSALLESMQERQVTIGDTTYPLPSPFLVFATQNPIEQQGTYPLPEAQVDRFMLKIRVNYPSIEEERAIVDRMTGDEVIEINPVISTDEIFAARDTVKKIRVEEKIRDYVLDLVFASRDPEKYGMADLAPLIQYGASPRASIFLLEGARAHAFVRGRWFVNADDVKLMAHDVLRHRILVSYEAEAEGKTSEDIIDRILSGVEVP